MSSILGRMVVPFWKRSWNLVCHECWYCLALQCSWTPSCWNCFPLYRNHPWLLWMEFKMVVEIGCALSALSEESHLWVGDYLHKLWNSLILFPEVSYETAWYCFQKCRGAWCVGCFKAHDLDQFEIKMPRDFCGPSLVELRFRVACPRDHLCTFFQCPNCQSWNIRGKDINWQKM